MRRVTLTASRLRDAMPDHVVHLVRAWAVNAEWMGIPVIVGEELAMFRNVVDFRLDGYSLHRVADIDRIGREGREDFTEHVLSDDGVLEDAPPVPLIPVESWRHAMSALQRLGHWVLIECEEEDLVALGPIVSVDDDQVLIHEVGPEGYMEREPFGIDLAAITMVRFADRYTTVFERFADQP